MATADIKASLVKNYKRSEYSAKTREKIIEFKNYVRISILISLTVILSLFHLLLSPKYVNLGFGMTSQRPHVVSASSKGLSNKC